MAGKSGRSINNVPESPVKKMIFSWEGILVLLFIAVNIFCAMFSEYYNLSSLLRQMPVYLAEVFMMLPMAYILVLGEIDISVGAIVCLSATMSCIVCNTNAPFIVVVITALGVGTICGAVNGFILTRERQVIKTDNADILRNTETAQLTLSDHTGSNQIVAADDRSRTCAEKRRDVILCAVCHI